MNIAMIGCGYVGLVSGACFADFGNHVVCVDKDPGRISALKNGVMPIYEPGLAELVMRNQSAGRLSFTANLVTAMAEADVVFIAVGTPPRLGEGHTDLSHIKAASCEIGAAIHKPLVVVNKSTAPVGTSDAIERVIRATEPDARFAVVSNPEFLREGMAIDDFSHPDRVVVGIEDRDGWAREVMAELYRPIVAHGHPVEITDRRTAELIKYAANAFLATKISFINEMADLCESVGAVVQDVARGMGLDRRIGPDFLNAGPGFGGSCFPKDTRSLLCMGRDHGLNLRIVESVIAVNDERKARMARKVIAACDGSVVGKTIAVLGLTFKSRTDDIRDSPAIAVIQALQRHGAQIRANDPFGMERAANVLENVEFADDPYDCADGADALVVATEWDEFKALDLPRLRERLAHPLIVDLRNIYAAESIRASGLDYVGVGRPVALRSDLAEQPCPADRLRSQELSAAS